MTEIQQKCSEQFTGAWNDVSRGLSKGMRASFLLMAVVFEGLSLGCVAVDNWLRDSRKGYRDANLKAVSE